MARVSNNHRCARAPIVGLVRDRAVLIDEVAEIGASSRAVIMRSRALLVRAKRVLAKSDDLMAIAANRAREARSMAE